MPEEIQKAEGTEEPEEVTNPDEVAPQEKEDYEGLMKEIQSLREKQQEAEERAEMLQEKLDSLNTQSDEQMVETDDDDIVTVKQAKAMVQAEISKVVMAMRVQRADEALKKSEYAEDFEQYLTPIIAGKKVLINRILDADDPVEEALEIMKRNPKYRKKLNMKDSKKIAENLNKPKNLSQVSGTSVGKKSPKEMTPEEVLAEQNKILS